MSLDWDDLRYVHAVAAHGSLAAAARFLGVSHTTVLRRIAGLETAVGRPLFERRPDGYAPTPAVRDLLPATATVARAVADLEAALAGGDLRLAGPLRVTCADALALDLMPGILRAFRGLHPDVDLELVVANTPLDLAKREADVALRQMPEPSAALIGRRLARLRFGFYASRDYLAGAPVGPFDPLAHPLILPDETADAGTAGAWVRARLPAGASVALQAPSYRDLRRAALAGLGVAFLPCHAGDGAAGLVRARPAVDDPGVELWVVTHERLRRTVRVRAFMDVVAQAVAAERDLIEGRRPVR